MKFDEVLSVVGDFGRYQRWLYFLICIPVGFMSMQLAAPIFILEVPDHRCRLVDKLDDTYQIMSENHKRLVNYTIPTKTDEDGKSIYSKCSFYERRIENHSSTNDIVVLKETDCDEWVYDRSTFVDTVATELDLVCSDSVYTAHGASALNIGSLVGFLVGGFVADRFGRKKSYMAGLICLIITTHIVLWLPNVYVFILFRFLIGVAFGIFYNAAFVFALELIGPKRRTVFGIVINHFWAAGMILHAGIAYGIRSWRFLQLATALPYILFLIYFWILPESPRWLFTMGKIKEGKRIVLRMAEINKVQLSEEQLIIDGEDTELTDKGNFWDLFKSRVLLIRTLVVFLNWMIVAMLYYGLTLNVGNMGGSLYLNYLLTCAVEFIAYTLCIPGLFWVGRRTFHCTGMIVGGAALLISIFQVAYGNESTHWVLIMLTLIGKLGSSAAFATIYLFSAELFPTVVRNSAMGACAFFSCVGALFAPYIVEWAEHLDGLLHFILPALLFGISSVVSGVLALILPETKDRHLPDTLDEFKNMGRKSKSGRHSHKKTVISGEETEALNSVV